IGRRVSNGNDYRLKLRYQSHGSVVAFITKTVGNVETTLATTSITGLVSPGDVLRVRFQVTGTNPTNLQAKVWRSTTTEPAAWLFTATDTTAALNAPGGVGVLLYLSGTWTGALPVVSIDNLTAGPLQGG
ncbi:MAG: PKD domain-containing protein, partial [Acidimicrobiia bacterium]